MRTRPFWLFDRSFWEPALVLRMWWLVLVLGSGALLGDGLDAIPGRNQARPPAKPLAREQAVDLDCKGLNEVPMSVRSETVEAAMPDGVPWDDRLGSYVTLSCLGEPIIAPGPDGAETIVCPAGRPIDSLHRAIACALRASTHRKRQDTAG